jgi:hypothetical protein
MISSFLKKEKKKEKEKKGDRFKRRGKKLPVINAFCTNIS